jgi:RNA polymerase sigma-70 factor, ECF subfamily
MASMVHFHFASQSEVYETKGQKQMNLQKSMATTNRSDRTPEVVAQTASHDAYLVAQAKSGCSISFGELYERHRSKVQRTALRILRNEQDAEDATQKAFQRAYTNLHRFRGDSTFLTWITRIAINEALMMLRHDRKTVALPENNNNEADQPYPVDLVDDRPTPEQTLAENELRAAVNYSVSRLRPSLQTVVQLRELQGCSTAETARRLGLSVPAVKARLFHARRNLRRHFERRYRVSASSFVMGTCNAKN